MLAEVLVIPIAEEVPTVETNQDAEGAEVDEDDPSEIHTPGSEPFSRATQMQ